MTESSVTESSVAEAQPDGEQPAKTSSDPTRAGDLEASRGVTEAPVGGPRVAAAEEPSERPHSPEELHLVPEGPRREIEVQRQLVWVPPPLEDGAPAFDLADWVGQELVAKDAPEPVDADLVRELSSAVLLDFEQDKTGLESLPVTASRVIELLESSDIDLDDLISVIGQDPAISAKILNVANSVWYRRQEEIQELRPAALLLGSKEVANVALSVAGRVLFDMEARAKYAMFADRWNGLYLDAMTHAFASSWLCSELRIPKSERAFLGGMFHDIGKTVALRTLSNLMMRGEIGAQCSNDAIDLVLENVHIDFGVSLLAAWGLPEYLTTVCLRHHDPRVPEVAEFEDLHAVRVVSLLGALRDGEVDADYPVNQLRQSLTALRMNLDQTRRLHEHMRGLRQRLAQTLAVG